MLAVRCRCRVAAASAVRRTHTAVPAVPTLAINSELPRNVSAVPTHELFVKAGMVAPARAGLFHWLPVGAAILHRLELLVRARMEAAGAEEISLLLVSLAALWRQTGRWDNPELFKLHDGGGDEFCLAPTCEEEVTALARHAVRGYRDLPRLYFQIGRKYRDEKRPRAGLLRAREFVMKDAYSFDASEAAALAMYDRVVAAYVAIFADLRVPVVKAEADSGAIGGILLHEWHYLSALGEDRVFTCSECGQSLNVEKTLSFPPLQAQSAPSANGGIQGASAPTAAVEYFLTSPASTLVCAYYPASRSLEPTLLKLHLPDIDLSLRAPSCDGAPFGAFHDLDLLMGKRVIRIIDPRLGPADALPDFPIPFVNRLFITTLFDTPIVAAHEGEVCGTCEEGTLGVNRAIEVGHTFYLGDRYTKALGWQMEVPEGTSTVKRHPLMGCYGIGVSRIIAAIGEILRDADGFRWPAAIAPWSATVIDAQGNEDRQILASRQLATAAVPHRVDARSVGLGRKVRDAALIGVPLAVIVGKKWPMVEIEVRGVQFEQSWRAAQRDASEWLVEEATEKTRQRHTVHYERLGECVAALLRDM